MTAPFFTGTIGVGTALAGGVLTEPTDPTYKRQTIGMLGTSGGVGANSDIVAFYPQASWGTLAYFAIYAANGTVQWSGPLTNMVATFIAQQVAFLPGGIAVNNTSVSAALLVAWATNPQRTVEIDTPGIVIRTQAQSGGPTPMAAREGGVTCDDTIDISGLLAPGDYPALASCAMTCSSDDITVNWCSFQGPLVTARTTGGIAGSTYNISLTWTTVSGLTGSALLTQYTVSADGLQYPAQTITVQAASASVVGGVKLDAAAAALANGNPIIGTAAFQDADAVDFTGGTANFDTLTVNGQAVGAGTITQVAGQNGPVVTAGQIATALGLGGAAVLNVGTTAGTVADGGAVAGKLAAANNLSDLASASAARANLGLNTAALMASTSFDAAGAATAAVLGSIGGDLTPATITPAWSAAAASLETVLSGNEHVIQMWSLVPAVVVSAGAISDWTPYLAQAVSRSITVAGTYGVSSTGSPTIIRFPAGRFNMGNAAAIPDMPANVVIEGDGNYRTQWLFSSASLPLWTVGTGGSAYTKAAFLTWVCNPAWTLPGTGTTQGPLPNPAWGPGVKGISFIGSGFPGVGTPSTTDMSMIAFVGSFRFNQFHDANFWSLPGVMIAQGWLNSSYATRYSLTQSTVHETEAWKVRANDCGPYGVTLNSGFGALACFSTAGTGGLSDNQRWYNTRAYAARGDELEWRAISASAFGGSASGGVTTITMVGVGLEGSRPTNAAPYTGSLLRFFASGDAGLIGSFFGTGMMLQNGYGSGASLMFDGGNSCVLSKGTFSGIITAQASDPTGYDMNIGCTFGPGVVFDFASMSASSGVTANILVTTNVAFDLNDHGSGASIVTTSTGTAAIKRPSGRVTTVGPSTTLIIDTLDVVDAGGAQSNITSIALSAAVGSPARGGWGISSDAEAAPVVLTTTAPGTLVGGHRQCQFASVPDTIFVGQAVSDTYGSTTVFAFDTVGNTVTFATAAAIPSGTALSFLFNAGSYPVGLVNDDAGNALPPWVTVNRANSVPTFRQGAIVTTGTPGAGGTAAASQAYADASAAASVATETTRATAAEATKAPLASPALTGTPTTPTGTAGAGGTQIASQAYADASATAAGVAAASGKLAPLPGGWKANRWYAAVNSSNFGNLAVGIALRPYATPVYVPNNVTVKQLAFYITTADSSAWNARLMVFSDTGAGAPGTAVIDSGAQAIAASATGVQSLTLGTPVALTAGWYWFVFIADTTAVSVSSISASSATSMTQILGSASATQALWTTTEITGVYGTALSAIGSTFTTFGTVSYPAGGATPQIAVGL